MRNTHHATRTLAAAIACAGLAATAAAQDASAPRSTVSTSTTIMKSGDGQSYEIRLDNGSVTSFKLNGKEVDPHTYKVDTEGGFIVFKDGDNEPVVIDIPRFGATGLDIGGLPRGSSVFPRTPTPPRAPAAGDAIEWMDAPEPATPPQHAWAGQEPPKVMIGITHDEVSQDLRQKLGLGEGEGIHIIEVRKGLPADKAGLKPGDVLIEADGRRIERRDILMDIMNDHKPGDKLNVLVLRDGDQKKLGIELAPFDRERLGVQAQSRSLTIVPSAPGQPRIRINDGAGDADIFGDFDLKFDMQGLPSEVRLELEKALKQARDQANEARARAFTLRRDADGQRRLLELRAPVHENAAREHEELARGHAEEMKRLEERLAKLRELGASDHLFQTAPGGRAFIIQREEADDLGIDEIEDLRRERDDVNKAIYDLIHKLSTAQSDKERQSIVNELTGAGKQASALHFNYEPYRRHRDSALSGDAGRPQDQSIDHMRAERDDLMARNRELEARVDQLERRLEELMKRIEKAD